MNLSAEDRALLENSHNELKNDKVLQNAIHKHAMENGLFVPENARFSYGIDCVCILVDNHPVIWVGTRKEPNYTFEETEYTDRYLRARQPAAV